MMNQETSEADGSLGGLKSTALSGSDDFTDKVFLCK